MQRLTMATLLLIPLEDTVVFPTMDVTLPVDVGDEERVLLVPRHDGEYASVGTIARVTERVRLPGGARGAMFEGVARGIAGAAETDARGRLRVEVVEHPDDVPIDGRTRDLEREYRATIEEILELRGDDGRISAWLRAISEPGALADTSGYSPDLTFEQKLELLQTLDVTERLEKALGLQRERLAELQVRRKIRDDVEDGVGKQQREYVLRKQMESIRRELGEDDGSIVDEYRKKIEDAGMPDEVREQAERELGRLERMGEGGGEGNMVRTYLDWLIAVPWSKSSEDRLDPVHTREVLDSDHAGLDDVKDRIVEYGAVKKPRTQRGPARGARPGAELHVPRPLPRRRGRPERGRLHRDRQPGRDDPRPAAGPHGGHPLRRLHRRREGGHRARLPVAAPARAQRAARGRGLRERRDTGDRGQRVHARGRSPQPRARARDAAAQDRDADRVGPGGRPRGGRPRARA